jgi:hypothetical protein
MSAEPEIIPMSKAVARKDEAAPTSAPSTENAMGVSQLVSVLHALMTNPEMSPERVKQAFDFYKLVDADQSRKAFNAAMAEARAEIPPIVKNREVDFTSQKGRTNYRHEDLAGIAKIIDPILGRHGLSYRFRTTSTPNEPICVTCIVFHRMGYSEENTLIAPRDDTGNKNSIQQIGSTITYLQRYTLKAALGLSAAHDDAGKGASGAASEKITSEQAETLKALTKKANLDLQIIYEHFKVDRVDMLTPEQYRTATNKINKKLQLEGAK